MNKYVLQELVFETLEVKAYEVYNSLAASKGALKDLAIHYIEKKEGLEKASKCLLKDFEKYDGYYVERSETEPNVIYLKYFKSGWLSNTDETISKYFISEVLSNSKEVSSVSSSANRLPSVSSKTKLICELESVADLFINKNLSLKDAIKSIRSQVSDSDIEEDLGSDEELDEELESSKNNKVIIEDSYDSDNSDGKVDLDDIEVDSYKVSEDEKLKELCELVERLPDIILKDTMVDVKKVR